jgi:NAD(P)-dependent dehydrogenase (short-subunit alcohol dehydrogenase family)
MSGVLPVGGNTGIGLETCKALAAKGFSVLLASRDAGKGKAAQDKIKCGPTVLLLPSNPRFRRLGPVLQTSFAVSLTSFHP